MARDFDAIVSAMLDRLAAGSRALIGIDGIGASGKSTFAAAVARSVPGRPVLLLHLDDFFHPSRMRHRRGRHSAEGFWLDAYDHDTLITWTLEPLSDGGDGRYRSGCYDRTTGERATPDRLQAPADALVRRYQDAQRLYFAAARPWRQATVVVDNNAPDSPRIIAPSQAYAARSAPDRP